MVRNQLRELVFITYPGIGHLLPLVKLARNLVAHQSHNINQLSAVIVLMKPPLPDEKVDSFIQSLKSSHDRDLTLLELPPLNIPADQITRYTSIAFTYVEAYKPQIQQTLTKRYGEDSPSTTQQQQREEGGDVELLCAGLVLDMFCSSLIDVSDSLGVPSYVFFSSGTSLLLLLFHLCDHFLDLAEVDGGSLDETLIMDVLGFENPVPMKVCPQTMLQNKDFIFNETRRLRRSKGIIVNTFIELEPSIIHALSTNESDDAGRITSPPIYPMGPILTITNDEDEKKTQIISWLDTQPPASVVFLCFGSKGCFQMEQLKEIAAGLERSGQRFLWSIRRPTEDSNIPPPTADDSDHFTEILPEGFLDRTDGIGKVIGWAPQVAVLEHEAIGAFMSHCGWNSIIESLWFGVPILAWPMYAEQQVNAFVLVKELGLAVEIRLDYIYDYRKGTASMVVGAEEVEKGIRRMMVDEEGKRVKRKVKEVSEIGKKVLLEDGSSYQFMSRFVDDVFRNLS